MPTNADEKTQPWKAMKSLDENPKPDFDNMPKFFKSGTTDPKTGASVSKPLDRNTKHETQE
jgi:hypothetical protein